MGPGRLELPTSRLSGVRSNQLSYEPSQTVAGTPFRDLLQNGNPAVFNAYQRLQP